MDKDWIKFCDSVIKYGKSEPRRNKILEGIEMEETKVEEIDLKEDKRIDGKIIKISSEGYGFISSKDVPFTRIFFHWTSLRPDTLKFTELKSGMKVSFVAFNVEDKGFRAIKIKVEE